MRSHSRSLRIWLSLLFLLFPVRGPSQATRSAEPQTVIRKSVEEVSLSFSITDSKGTAVEDVEAKDITILDDGQPIQSLTSFARCSRLGLRVGLVVDLSDSMKKDFPAEQRAAAAFLQYLLPPRSDSAFVMGFAQQPTDQWIPISKLCPGGLTSLYDALYRAAGRDLVGSPGAYPVGRAIILLSDGEDNDSRHSLEEAIEEAENNDVTVYPVGIRHRKKCEFAGKRVLEQIAEQTGGRAFVLDSYGQIPRVFSQIDGELRSRYAVTYRCSEAPACSGFHEIKVLVNSGRHLIVRCRRGYHAPAGFLSCASHVARK